MTPVDLVLPALAFTAGFALAVFLLYVMFSMVRHAHREDQQRLAVKYPEFVDPACAHVASLDLARAKRRRAQRNPGGKAA